MSEEGPRANITGETYIIENGEAKKVSKVDYNEVVSELDGLISEIKNTDFLLDNMTYSTNESESNFFTSLDAGESYLYNVSSNLFHQISIGVDNVYTMLNRYAALDASLSSLAGELSDGYDSLFNIDSSSSINYENTQIYSFDDLSNFNAQLFKESNKIGKVGKISVSDLNGILNQKTTALNIEIDNANKLTSELSNFINTPNLSGPGWDSLKQIFQRYRYCNEIRAYAAEVLRDAYEKAINKITKYMDPYDTLDDREIPKVKAEIARLKEDIEMSKQKIIDLKAENVALAAVGPDCKTDEKGRPYDCDWGPVWAARKRIQANNRMIADLNIHIKITEELKAEAEKLLAKLEGLAAAMDEAFKIIDEAMNTIDSMYANFVYGTNTPRLSSLSSSNGMEYYQETNTNNRGDTDVWFMRLSAGILPMLGLSTEYMDNPNSTNTEDPRTIMERVGASFATNGGVFRGPVYSNGTWYFPEDTQTQLVRNGGQMVYMTVDGQLGVIDNLDENGNYVAEERLSEVHPPVAWAVNGFTQLYGENSEGEYSYLEAGVDVPDSYHDAEHRAENDTPRTFIAQTASGDIILGTTEGRGSGNNSSGMNAEEMCDFICETANEQNSEDPVVFIYNLDGGGSCYFNYNNGETTVEHHEQNSSSGQYSTVPDGSGNNIREVVSILYV